MIQLLTLKKFIPPKFEPKQKIINVKRHKLGYVNNLRIDKSEQENNWSTYNYHYSITYDDGTTELYEKQTDLIGVF